MVNHESSFQESLFHHTYMQHTMRVDIMVSVECGIIWPISIGPVKIPILPHMSIHVKHVQEERGITDIIINRTLDTVRVEHDHSLRLQSILLVRYRTAMANSTYVPYWTISPGSSLVLPVGPTVPPMPAKPCSNS